jgi:hypothetical protein
VIRASRKLREARAREWYEDDEPMVTGPSGPTGPYLDVDAVIRDRLVRNMQQWEIDKMSEVFKP